MIEETSKKRKLITIICAVAAAIVIAIITAVVLLNNQLNDNFFVSDGSKYVFSMDQDEILGLDFEEYEPEKVHLAYFYSDGKVTDVKLYYAYENGDMARKAAEYIKGLNDINVKEVTVSGKYVVVTAKETLYEDMTDEDARQQVEIMEMVYNTNYEEDAGEETDREYEEGEEKTIDESGAKEENVEEENLEEENFEEEEE